MFSHTATGIALVCFISFLGNSCNAATAEPSADEYKVKGAFLLNFAKFIEWPAATFRASTDPISICIFGKSPFGAEFERAAKSLDIGGHKIAIQDDVAFTALSACQIVFVSSAERKRIRPLFERLKGMNVLTVGEIDGFLNSGGVINFGLDGGKIRIEINAEAAEQANLRISAKLLSLGQARRK